MAPGNKSNSSSGNGFQPLGLSDPVFRGIVRMGFRNPTPVQRKALPVILTGSDVCVMARTGSGKTCAFLVPILEKLLESPPNLQKKCRAVVLSPTRELSLQTLKVMNKLAHFCDIKSIGIHGGEGMEKQFNAMASKPDVIVATPGRLAHHLSEIPDFDLRGCQMIVLDEADRLIEMGFAQQIRQIASTLPDYCQKVMLSATMPKVLIEFTKSGFSTDPEVVRLDQEASVSEDLRIAFITCRSADKDAALLHVLEHIQRDKNENEGSRTGLTLIFAATRHHVEYISTLLSVSGIDSTLIYGTLDQEARKSNLSAFRTGKKAVLVVTDVAARGIDVPLIDHVIHYAFPANAKLFVHRSGRAARAGRIGYCWGLVEPDEMPYMVDLHLFLGRRLSTGTVEKDGNKEEIMYTLNEMTPNHVHYGGIPEAVLTREVENVRRIMESELTGSNQAETLRALTKVCNNAMKQYRRTRPEASKEGIRRAKAILEGERQETGQRIGGGAIPAHPLLRGMEHKDYQDRVDRGSIDSIHTLQNLRKREDFLRMMSNFRPKETVFEAFATGGGKDVGVVSHVDKGRTSGPKKHDNSAAFTAMKSMRRQMRIAHDKGNTLVVAGSVAANREFESHVPQQASKHDLSSLKPTPALAIPEGKRRLSKADRRRLKSGKPIASAAPSQSQPAKAKDMRGSDFRDESFFMENDFSSRTDDAGRARQVEAAMQPSASSNLKGMTGAALRLEEAMIDIVGDEQADLVQKQRMMKWDKSKRKYVKTTVGDELSGDSKSKKMRLESGQLVKTDKMKLGELYEKWQKRTNRSIGRTGVFDDVTDAGASTDLQVHGNGTTEDKPISASRIRKEREKKSNMKLKNMKKADRRRIEVKHRQEKNAKLRAAQGKVKKAAGPQRKGKR